MRSIRLIAVLLAVLAGLVSCSRDPNVVKKRYLESGNKYFEKGRFKEASIQYRNALKRDQKFGAAHYKLALVALKTGDIGGAVGSLRRAIELIPPDQPDHWDAVVRISEIYLAVAKTEKTYMDEVDKFTKELIKRDPNSFDAHRLIGDLNFSRALGVYMELENGRNTLAESVKAQKRQDSLKLLDAAIDEYRKADAIKPGQQGVSMQLARSLQAKADYGGAEKLFRSVLEKDKTYQQVYRELYTLYLQQRKANDAEQVLKLAFQNNPKQFVFLTMLAMHYGALQRRQDMIDVLNQIKSHAKDYDQAYLTVGDFYLRLGDPDSAIREYKEGIAKDAKKKSTYQKREIEVLMRQGKTAEAAGINAEILKDDPNDNDARGLAASLMLDKGEVAQALGELQALVTRDPKNAVARYNLGRAHIARGEGEQARQQFQKAVEINPNDLRPRLALARLQIARSEFDAALKNVDGILAIDKGNAMARLVQSAALMGQKKFGESRALLDGMLKITPGSPDVVFQLGVVNLAEGRYKEAEEAFRRSYQLSPGNARGLMGIVETNLAQNKPDEALKILQAESDKAPARLDLLMAIGNTAVRAGRFDYAIQTYNKMLTVMDKEARRGDIYLRIGETCRRKGDLASAVQALEKARESMPDDITVLSTLGLVLDASSRRPEARKMYEETLKRDPNNAVVLNNLAFLLAETGGDLDDAMTKATRAKQLLPSLLEVSDTLGWIYLKKNLPDNAIDIFKDLVAKQPAQSTYHYHLGMAYSQKGDKSKALDQLREALKYNPAKEEKDRIEQLITRLG